MADPTQLGQELVIGIGSYSIDGYFTENVTITNTGQIDEVLDEDGATATKIISNKGKRISGRFIAKADGGSPEDTEMATRTLGDIISINNTAYMVEKWDISRTPGSGRCAVDLECIKENSMDYS